jgi:ABC-type molybdate transport system substrate-binding protein
MLSALVIPEVHRMIWNGFARAGRIALMIALVSSPVFASELRVVAAGSLKDAFTAIFADYAKLHGIGFAPAWGPSGVLRERLQSGEAFDVFASAALPHAQALTDAGVSGPSVLFARNALCIVTAAGRRLDGSNLVETLLRPDIKIGTSTPVADPAGDYTWELFHRIDAQRAGAFETLSNKAQQLVGGTTTSVPANGRHPLLVALDDGEIDLFVYYCSGAKLLISASTKYQMVELPTELTVSRIWPNGRAEGGAGGCGFRDVSAVAAGAEQPEIVWIYSGDATGRALMRQRVR